MSFISGKIRVPKKPRNILALAIIVSLLTACGGGSDSDGGSNSQPQNRAPSANAGSDQSVNENTNVTLIGSGTDPDGSISSYRWIQTGGPSVTLQSASSSTASFQAPQVATSEQLTFELTVTDNDGASAADRVQITVLNVNQPPSANAGVDQSVVENTNVTLSGSGTDPDGSTLSYRWTQTSGSSVTLQSAESATTSFQSPIVAADEQLSFELTVTDSDGASATDSVLITVAKVNLPPSANAGESREALESTLVTLDGGASTDPDGSISSYHWVQISNGAPVVTINNATSNNASVELPALANDVEFEFRLTVTDNDGESAQDDVTITGRPKPQIAIGNVSGNTAALNAVAEFSVQLTSKPTFDVKIPLSSSDQSEGVTEQSELTFTPDNWQQAQVVVVRGANRNVQNGEQDYQIIVGAAVSSDPFYNGVKADDVNLKGIALEVSQPATLNQLIAGIESTFQPQIKYTGNNQLSFSLTESPTGMNIDLSSGLISWTPQEADESKSYTVAVAVNDGNKFATTEFQVSVIAPAPLVTEVSGSTLSVVDSSTTLNGMTITTLSDVAEATAASTYATSASAAAIPTFELTKLPVSSVPEIPASIIPLTDVLVVRGTVEGTIEIRFPIANRPANVLFGDIRLYAYTKAHHVEGQFWSPVSIKIDYEGTVTAPVIVIKLGGLEGMAFIGYEAQQPSSSPAQSSSRAGKINQRAVIAANTSADSITCEQRFIFEEPQDEYICRSTEDEDVNISISGFGNGNMRWGGASGGVTKTEIVAWLIDAQEKFSSFSVGYDKSLKVEIHNMSHIGRGILGYVTTSNSEQRKTLHLTDDNSRAVSTMKGTTVHEYFHHAQGHPDTKIADKSLSIDLPNSNWLIEGTARWFEDELYDSLDTYESKEGNFGYRIAEVGINANSGDGISRPYQRFSFFKQLTTSCANFTSNFKSALNRDFAVDGSGIKNLSEHFDDWSCNFGSHLGADKSSSLEAALTYYNYATQHKNDLSLLDPNEPNNRFRFDRPNYQFNQTWLSSITEWLSRTDNTVHKLNGVSNIPAAGAYSFKVPSISGELPEGKVAELVIESNREVIASITSDDSGFSGSNTIGAHPHFWFSTLNQTSYVYDANGSVPELFVTLVNPSLDNSANVEVYFKIRDELDVDTIITSHATGDQVSNRVITIVGNIPEEARDSTSKVTVTANGLAIDTTLNSDGSFAADVVVSVGDNLIKAQGYSGTTPITNEEVITIQGVESTLSGRNALIASRVVFVLRWDTNATDLDIYSTDKNGGTIWYSDRTKGPGNLDYDNTRGFGPEVVSYREVNEDVFVNGTFDIDVHYFSGSPPTNYTLDVVLNETEGGNRRSLKFESIVAHTQSNSSQDGANGSGNSRFNDVLAVSCSNQRVCSLSGFDNSKLVQAGSSTIQTGDATQSVRAASTNLKRVQVAEPIIDTNRVSAYKQCMAEYERSINKAGNSGWSCASDGAKRWH